MVPCVPFVPSENAITAWGRRASIAALRLWPALLPYPLPHRVHDGDVKAAHGGRLPGELVGPVCAAVDHDGVLGQLPDALVDRRHVRPATRAADHDDETLATAREGLSASGGHRGAPYQ